MPDMSLTQVIAIVQAIKPRFEADGIYLLGLFGSYAKGQEDRFSDIDIAYKIDHRLFSKKYNDGFGKLLRLEDVKKTLEKALHKQIDLVSLDSKNRSFIDQVMKEIIYV